MSLYKETRARFRTLSNVPDPGDLDQHNESPNGDDRTPDQVNVNSQEIGEEDYASMPQPHALTPEEMNLDPKVILDPPDDEDPDVSIEETMSAKQVPEISKMNRDGKNDLWNRVMSKKKAINSPK